MFNRLSASIMALCLLALTGTPLAAHQTGESYVYLNVFEDRLEGRYEIPLRDAALLFDLDADSDGIVTQAEFAAQADKVQAHFQTRIRYEVGGQNAPITFTGVEFFETPGFTFAQLKYDVAWQGPVPDQITVEHTSSYDDIDPAHRVLFLIESNTKTGLENNEGQFLTIFGSGTDSKEVSLTGASKWSAFSTFVAHGIHHLIIGFDHIAFLLALVLPSVLFVQGGKWAPAPSFGTALWNILKIATVFTIAHSVTLALAALDIVRLPAGPIEALIALSIIAAALVNILIVGRSWIYPTVFLLGLLHGLGFANVLEPLAMEPINLLPSLLGFNIGVEIGQVAILTVPFILLYFARNWAGYVPYVLKGGSGVLALVAVYWFAERGFDMASRLFS